jgi:hypothetical protein
MYACLRHLFTVGPWRVYWRHCFARGRFILCLRDLVWPALWLDRAYLCETEIADQYPHYFPPWEGFATSYELSLRMPGQFTLDMRGFGGLATAYPLYLTTPLPPMGDGWSTDSDDEASPRAWPPASPGSPLSLSRSPGGLLQGVFHSATSSAICRLLGGGWYTPSHQGRTGLGDYY